MGLVEAIQEHRVDIGEVDLLRVLDSLGWFERKHVDLSKLGTINNLRGRIAEQLVSQWLDECGSIRKIHLPQNMNDYEIEEHNSGTRIRRNGNGRPIEYDHVIRYKGQVYVVEVKSLKLNGIAGKIDRALQMGSELFDQNIGMVIFFPQYYNKLKDVARLEARWSHVHCVNSGYKKKQLLNATSRAIELFERERIYVA